jgi:ribose/xylose/arabinose/galactoside ABC-type transport system permease subunit
MRPPRAGGAGADGATIHSRWNFVHYMYCACSASLLLQYHRVVGILLYCTCGSARALYSVGIPRSRVRVCVYVCTRVVFGQAPSAGLD